MADSCLYCLAVSIPPYNATKTRLYNVSCCLNDSENESIVLGIGRIKVALVVCLIFDVEATSPMCFCVELRLGPGNGRTVEL